MTKNFDIKSLAIESGVKLWEIADAMNMHESAFSKSLRKELPDEKKAEIIKIIADIRSDKGGK